MDTTHVVKIIRRAQPGIRFVHASDFNIPDFPDLSSADRFAKERAQQAECTMRVIVEEKRNGRRKVEYQADGGGKVKRVPLV